MADSIPSDVLSFLRTRFRSRSITIGLPPDGKAGPWLSDYQEPAIDRLNGRTLEAIRKAGAVPAACVPEAGFVEFIEARGYDPCSIINELMARKLVSHIVMELLPLGESGPIPPQAVIEEKDLGVAHPDFLPGLHRCIAIHADILNDLPTPNTSGRGQPEGAGVSSKVDDRQAVEDEADDVANLPQRACDILRVMRREGITSPGKAWSQDNIAGEVQSGFDRASLKNPFATLRKRGLISATGSGAGGGTYLTPAGIAAAERLVAPNRGK